MPAWGAEWKLVGRRFWLVLSEGVLQLQPPIICDVMMMWLGAVLKMRLITEDVDDIEAFIPPRLHSSYPASFHNIGWDFPENHGGTPFIHNVQIHSWATSGERNGSGST